MIGRRGRERQIEDSAAGGDRTIEKSPGVIWRRALSPHARCQHDAQQDKCRDCSKERFHDVASSDAIMPDAGVWRNGLSVPTFVQILCTIHETCYTWLLSFTLA